MQDERGRRPDGGPKGLAWLVLRKMSLNMRTVNPPGVWEHHREILSPAPSTCPCWAPAGCRIMTVSRELQKDKQKELDSGFLRALSLHSWRYLQQPTAPDDLCYLLHEDT